MTNKRKHHQLPEDSDEEDFQGTKKPHAENATLAFGTTEARRRTPVTQIHRNTSRAFANVKQTASRHIVPPPTHSEMDEEDMNENEDDADESDEGEEEGEVQEDGYVEWHSSREQPRSQALQRENACGKARRKQQSILPLLTRPTPKTAKVARPKSTTLGETRKPATRTAAIDLTEDSSDEEEAFQTMLPTPDSTKRERRRMIRPAVKVSDSIKDPRFCLLPSRDQKAISALYN